MTQKRAFGQLRNGGGEFFRIFIAPWFSREVLVHWLRSLPGHQRLVWLVPRESHSKRLQPWNRNPAVSVAAASGRNWSTPPGKRAGLPPHYFGRPILFSPGDPRAL